MDWFDLLAVQGTPKSLLQHHSSKSSVLRHSAFFTVQRSHPYMSPGNTIALTRQTFVVASQDCCCQSLYPPCRTLLMHALPQHLKAGRAQSLVGVTAPFPGSWCAQGFVCALQASLMDIRFDFKRNCAPPTILLWLLLCPWSWGLFFWWVPTFSC